MKRNLRNVLTVGLIFSLAFTNTTAAETLFPNELVHFEPSETNPVFSGRGKGHWDVRIRERGWILREADSYHMWFTGYDGSKHGLRMLGYATSHDGLHWVRHGDEPLDRTNWIEDMIVVKHGGTYYMFAEGFKDQAHLFTSRDRVHWMRVGPIDPGPFGTPTVWLENNIWHLYYERRDLGIWLATSNDLRIWTNVQDEPVLTPGPNIYDEHLVAMNQIVKHDGRYYAYYHGSSRNRPGIWTTNVAVSEDLIHWTKYSRNPIRPAEENKSSGILVRDEHGFRLYTMHPEVHVHFPDLGGAEDLK